MTTTTPTKLTNDERVSRALSLLLDLQIGTADLSVYTRAQRQELLRRTRELCDWVGVLDGRWSRLRQLSAMLIYSLR